MFSELDIPTRRKIEFINITPEIEDLVRKAKVEEGLCHVFIPHTTAAATINENADPSVVKDIINHLEGLVPADGHYSHREGNSPAHIKSSLLGNSVDIFIKNNSLSLGTWQGVFFCEFDGPRRRKAWVMIRR